MAITAALGFDPIWSNFNIFGVSAGGASLYSYDSLNPTVLKPIYSDPGAFFPYPDPILFDQNGNAPGPFYFIIDSLNPKSLYDLFLYDAQGNLIWNVNNYYPSGGSGGSAQTNVNLQNLILNSVFWRNIGGINPTPTPIPITSTITAIAPGGHDGLSANIDSTATPTQHFGPDIYLIKNNTSASETVTFTQFTLGSTPFGTTDVTPIEYLTHTTNGTTSGEAYKYYQIPINAKVQNLSGQPVTTRIWAQGVSGTQTLTLSLVQFFGDGVGATPPFVFPIQTINLTNAWVQTISSFTIPSASGNTLGPCGNDGLFLWIGIPLNTACTINFTKPSMYLGNIVPGPDFVNYDTLDAALNTPRTGDVRVSLNNFLFGYVPLNDGSIGNVGSSATTRAQKDTFPLYNLIWNSVSRIYAPLATTSLGSATLDFVGNNALYLTKALGRVLAGTTNTQIVQVITAVGGTTIAMTNNAGFNPGDPIQFKNNGGTLPGLLVEGPTYYVLTLIGSNNITVSATFNGPPITPSSQPTGSPTVSLTPYLLGQYAGEETHFQSLNEIAQHTHSYLGLAQPGPLYQGGSTGGQTSQTGGVTGLNAQVAFNIIQPTTYMNMFMKL